MDPPGRKSSRHEALPHEIARYHKCVHKMVNPEPVLQVHASHPNRRDCKAALDATVSNSVEIIALHAQLAWFSLSQEQIRGAQEIVISQPENHRDVMFLERVNYAGRHVVINVEQVGDMHGLQAVQKAG